MRDIQDVLGFRFRDRRLLEEALTHRSFAHARGGGGTRSNERLEFLGDAVLELAVSDLLFREERLAGEGDLSRARAWLVNDRALAEVAAGLGLGPYLRLSASADRDGARERESVLSDVLEALIGAAYLDQGWEAARELVKRLLGQGLEKAMREAPLSDYKTMLQEWSVRERGILPAYRCWGEGPDHCRTFHAEVMLGEEKVGTGTGRSKKEAEQGAAREACRRFFIPEEKGKGECMMAARIGVVTDSTAYLSESFVRDNDIKVVPLKVIFGDEVYREGVDISHEEFFRKLKEYPGFPTTSQPSVGEFAEAYREMGQRCQQILSLHISAGISGTVESARSAAAEFKDLRIEVVDSRFTSIGMWMLLDAVMEDIRSGADLDAVLPKLQEIIGKMRIYFAVDTLEYLHKGGRIGGAQAFLGSVLKVKPILSINGTIDAEEKARGTQKAVARIVEMAAEQLRGRKAALGITHVFDPEAGESLRRRALESIDCDPSRVIVNETGPVIGAHTGPGTVGLAFYPL